MNIAVTFLYQSGLWLPDTDACKLSKWLYSFLGHYACLAKWSVEAGKKRFPLYPKAHMVAHTALQLSRVTSGYIMPAGRGLYWKAKSGFSNDEH